MNPPDSIFWLRLFGIFAAEISAIIAIAFLAEALTKSVFWRRTIWQVMFLGLFLILFADGTGLGRGVAMWLTGKAPTEKKFSVRTFPVETEFVSPLEEPASIPDVIPQPQIFPEEKSVWWPAALWVAGFTLLLGRIVFSRLLLLALSRQKNKIHDSALIELVCRIASYLGLQQKIRLLQNKSLMGPIAFGVVRPSIGLPLDFKAKFSPVQQEAMLAHELAHLAARDPFWYFIADMATTFFWWHPLVWLARRRLHTTSELAADEATVLIENGPNTLAECLVTLGRQLSNSRGYGSLGVTGFRSNLGKRVERLLNLSARKRNPPHRLPLFLTRIVLTAALASLVVVTSGWIQNRNETREKDWSSTMQKSWNNSFGAFALAALTPENETKSSSPEPLVEKVESQKIPKTNEKESLNKKIQAAALAQNGKLFYEMGKLAESERKLKEALHLDPENKGAKYYLDLIGKAKHQVPELFHPTHREVVSKQRLVEVEKEWNDPLKRENLPRTNQVHTSAGRAEIISKLDKIRVNAFYDGLPMGEVLKALADESSKRDPDKMGLNFMIDPADISAVRITINPELRNLRLAEVLEAIVNGADRPIKFEIKDYAVVFSSRSPEAVTPVTHTFKVDRTKTKDSEILVTHKFKIDRNTFLEGLQGFGMALPASDGEVTAQKINEAIRDYFSKLGVDLAPPKSVFFNDRAGILLVRATARDQESIMEAIDVLTVAVPQVMIEARFVEIDDTGLKALGMDWFLEDSGASRSNQIGAVFKTSAQAQVVFGTANLPNGIMTNVTGILSEPQFKIVLSALKQRKVEVLSTPQVTTLSGRQAEISVLDLNTVVTGVKNVKGADGAITNAYQTAPMSFGTVLNIVPSVLGDDFSIQMSVVATVTEFLGYDEPDRFPTTKGYGKTELPLPRYRTRQVATVANVFDGQTIVLGGMVAGKIQRTKNKVPIVGDLPLVGKLFRSDTSRTVRKNLVVFITPTVVDPGGNRVHEGKELVKALNSIPAQPTPEERRRKESLLSTKIKQIREKTRNMVDGAGATNVIIGLQPGE